MLKRVCIKKNLKKLFKHLLQVNFFHSSFRLADGTNARRTVRFFKNCAAADRHTTSLRVNWRDCGSSSSRL